MTEKPIGKEVTAGHSHGQHNEIMITQMDFEDLLEFMISKFYIGNDVDATPLITESLERITKKLKNG